MVEIGGGGTTASARVFLGFDFGFGLAPPAPRVRSRSLVGLAEPPMWPGAPIFRHFPGSSGFGGVVAQWYGLACVGETK